MFDASKIQQQNDQGMFFLPFLMERTGIRIFNHFD